MLVLLLPHLDCIALPHCQPIGASPGSAHILPFATDLASCHSLLLEHAARCVPRACSARSGMGKVVEGEGWLSEPQAQQPLPCRPPCVTHDVGITGMQYSACLSPSCLGWGWGNRAEHG